MKRASALWAGASTAVTEVVTAHMEMNKGTAQHVDIGVKVGMQEQAAAALSDLAFGDVEMQDSIIHEGGVPPLLNLVRTGSQLAQEHAARAIWHLAASVDNQNVIVETGCSRDRTLHSISRSFT
jgi:hypothetical protein